VSPSGSSSDSSTGLAIEAVLLDIGGVFHLPDPRRIAAACERAEHPINPEGVPRAHYRATKVFEHPGDDATPPWARWWPAYLREFAASLGVFDEDVVREVLRHLADEFTTGGLWDYEIPGARDGLRMLADRGVRLGIVSNNDGEALTRLRAIELAQVGPGPGVSVECVIDSGAVGIEKPDARIFELALIAMRLRPEQCWYVGDMPGIDAVGARRAGIRPFIIDPYSDHDGAAFTGAEFESIDSLAALAELL
jgi:putative hydrolase of the HAD superfamily